MVFPVFRLRSQCKGALVAGGDDDADAFIGEDPGDGEADAAAAAGDERALAGQLQVHEILPSRCGATLGA